jgi:hypothetical protein
MSSPPHLSNAQRQASKSGLDIPRLEVLLENIENNLIQRSLCEKYKKIFYLASTGHFSADDLAQIFNHSSGNNLNSDFNKNLGTYLRQHFNLSERVGITSLRRILFRQGYFVDINDDLSVKVLPTRLAENSQLERSSNLDTISLDKNTINSGD